ncbi:MAG: tetratricopeptide repeat protein [Candidatus Berkelbacteria bacterium]|nr:tetratricopeptide repeat protein [Candidatus Berkelbacteria bacterium]
MEKSKFVEKIYNYVVKVKKEGSFFGIGEKIKTRRQKVAIISVCGIIIIAAILFFSIIIFHHYKEERANNFDKYYSDGQALLVSGDFSGAIDSLTKAVDVDSNNYNALFSLASAYYGTKDYQSAIKYFNQAATGKNVSKSSIAMDINSLGNAYRDSGQIDKAVESYKKAIENDSHNIFAYSNLAAVYYGQGDKNQAISILNAGIAANPSAKNLQTLLAKYKK